MLEQVWFAGPRADVPALLRGMDCFVLPSLSEGISNTILEAMATGLPVIATHVGGNAELIEDGMTGLLVPAANSELLARAMLSYYQNQGVARRHARTAQRVAAERFSLDRMVDDYSTLYESMLAQAEGGSSATGDAGRRGHSTSA